MKNVRKTNRRKRGKGSTKKLGGTTMRKIRRTKKTAPKLHILRLSTTYGGERLRPKVADPTPSSVKLSSPKTHPVVLGKIYSENCIHCNNMADAWTKMEDNLPDNYTVWNIESKDEQSKKKDFQNQHGVQLQSSGYPTIFMIIQGKQVDYNGNRDKDSLLQWALQTQ